MLLVRDLRVEYQTHPLGIDTLQPRFSWKLVSDGRNVLQQAYHLQVAMDPEFGTLLWDTGRTGSDQSIHVVYSGSPLQSRTRYYVRVRVIDQREQSNWSDVAWFETAFLSSEEWRGDWVSADGVLRAEPIHYLRTTFEVAGQVRTARVYATALGLYQLHLDGQRIGDAVLTPGWTSYHHQLQYQTYDVMAALSPGRHALGVVLGNGWYKGDLGWSDARNHYGQHRASLLQLHIVYVDGREQVVTTNGSWKASTGPILMSEIYHGETYDARNEIAGWSTPDFDDSAWLPVVSVDHTKDVLVAQINNLTRVMEEVHPKQVIHTPAGETVLDMGQNMVGWMRFRVQAPKDTVITLQHAEVLDKNGNFYTANLRSAKQTITYICNGDGVEEYEPHFTFQGFRYVKVEGYPANISCEAFTGKVVHTDYERTGSFECSNPLVNQLQRNIEWGQKGNFVDVPTDCPQRDERLGWTGDAQVFIRTATFNGNVALFFSKWLRDLQFDQFPDGGVPAVIPNVLASGHASSAWGDAAVICPWEIYQVYGDVRVLAQQYNSMKAWVEYIRAQGDDPLLWNTGFHYGDWLAMDAFEGSYVGATPRDLIATAFYAHSTDLLAKTAAILGQSDDAATYQDLRARIIRRFQEEFVTPTGRVVSETQTAHVLPLMFDLVDGPVRKRVATRLAEMIVQNGNRLQTGFVGTPYLCHVLTEHGFHELACTLVNQTEYPSWLFSVLQGATTIWEHWDGIKPDGSFWSADMNSFNHYAYGSVGDWMYRNLAGLDFSEGGAGCRHILIRPNPDRSFSFAKARYESMYGCIASEWSYDKQTNQLRVLAEIPPNTKGTIVLPFANQGGVMESGQSVREVDGIQSIRQVNDGVQLEVGSGIYAFHYPCAYPHKLSDFAG